MREDDERVGRSSTKGLVERQGVMPRLMAQQSKHAVRQVRTGFYELTRSAKEEGSQVAKPPSAAAGLAENARRWMVEWRGCFVVDGGAEHPGPCIFKEGLGAEKAWQDNHAEIIGKVAALGHGFGEVSGKFDHGSGDGGALGAIAVKDEIDVLGFAL